MPTIKLEPAQIANGAVELMNEVATSKITGEEDRYSHTDLWDFDANDDGARCGVQGGPADRRGQGRDAGRHDRPRSSRRPGPRSTSTRRPTAASSSTPQLTKADTKALSAQVEALADSLAKVPPLVVKA